MQNPYMNTHTLSLCNSPKPTESRHDPISDQTKPHFSLSVFVFVEFNPIFMASHGLTDTQGRNPGEYQQPLYPNAPV